MYQGINNVGARAYNNMFNYVSPTRDLRSADLLLAEVLKCKTKFGENNMAYRGAIYWNQLPIHIESLQAPDETLFWL